MVKKNSHTSALFHYTRNQNIVINILREGLKFSYCREEFSDDLCLGIPMICFCDIPVGASFEHSLKYGQYAIGLSKDKLLDKYKEALGPVNYVTSLSSVKAAFQLRSVGIENRHEIDTISKKTHTPEINVTFNGRHYKGKVLPAEYTNNTLKLFLQSIEYHHSSTQAISLMKPYQSIHDGNSQINYDECEWRIVLPEHTKLNDNEHCQWFWSKEEYDSWREKRDNKFINEMPLLFTVDDIEYIIVPTKELIPNFIKRLIDLKEICGNKIEDKDRYSLVSKVISLEQIKRDF